MQMAQFHGYPALQYTVRTDDGYILTLHRVPGSKYMEPIDALMNSWERQAVLLNHGVLSDSTSFIFTGNEQPSKSIAY